MYEQTRRKQYTFLRNMLNEHEHDINRCLQLINKVKEHRHDKIKRKQIDKFEHLYFKRYGYHHNFSKGSPNFDNIDTN